MPKTTVAVISAFLFFAGAAHPQEPAPPSPSEGAVVPGSAPPSLALTLPWTEPSGRGVSFSYENGAFGVDWEQGLKIQFPFNPFFALNIRPMLLMELSGLVPNNAISLGGRIELIGRTPVLLNLIRIYGGGGGGPFVDLTGPRKGQVSSEGGGQFGFEFFLQPHFSFYTEIGGNGCGAGAGLCSGATVVAGMSIYPWSLP